MEKFMLGVLLFHHSIKLQLSKSKYIHVLNSSNVRMKIFL